MRGKRAFLDKTSGYLFFFGFVAAKGRIIPIFILSLAFNYITFLTYIVGYLAWYIAAILYPSYPRKKDTWYGFAKFKEQYLLAAAIGLIASVLCAILPSMLIPAACLYVLSNVVWTISEFHKKNNPPNNEDYYSPSRQKLYIRYASLITLGSIVTASSLILPLIFPAAAFEILLTASIVGSCIVLGIIYHWLICGFKQFPDAKIPHSYHKISIQHNPNRSHTNETLESTKSLDENPKPRQASPSIAVVDTQPKEFLGEEIVGPIEPNYKPIV